MLAATLCLAGAVQAGVMTKATLQERFPSPLIVGERDAQLPVWPIFKQDATATPLVVLSDEYALSKRTTLYGQVVFVNAGATSGLMTTIVAGGTAPDTNTTLLNFGVKHSF